MRTSMIKNPEYFPTFVVAIVTWLAMTSLGSHVIKLTMLWLTSTAAHFHGESIGLLNLEASIISSNQKYETFTNSLFPNLTRSWKWSIQFRNFFHIKKSGGFVHSCCLLVKIFMCLISFVSCLLPIIEKAQFNYFHTMILHVNLLIMENHQQKMSFRKIVKRMNKNKSIILLKIIIEYLYSYVWAITYSWVNNSSFKTRMHSSRMRTTGSLPYRRVSLDKDASPPTETETPPPVDRQTPVKILPCPKLRLRAVTSCCFS